MIKCAFLAVDVNNGQKVTASDLVQMRKIILRIDEYYKANTSWIVMDEASVSTEANPWAIKKYIMIPEGKQDIDHLRFVALKVGDEDGAHKKDNRF